LFKVVILLARGTDMTREEFASWWLGEHAGLAQELEGLRELRFNLVETPDAEFDGVSELWFDSPEAFDAAYATEHGRRVADDSLAHVSRRSRLVVTEHTLK
jgi:uncharacterized protein (TIGR02118 family)